MPGLDPGIWLRCTLGTRCPGHAGHDGFIMTRYFSILKPSKEAGIQLSRAPHPILRPFVELVWASTPDAAHPVAARERMLPAASAHLVIRLGGRPLRLFASD